MEGGSGICGRLWSKPYMGTVAHVIMSFVCLFWKEVLYSLRHIFFFSFKKKVASTLIACSLLYEEHVVVVSSYSRWASQ